jgi:hypothetical protein
LRRRHVRRASPRRGSAAPTVGRSSPPAREGCRQRGGQWLPRALGPCAPAPRPLSCAPELSASGH